MLSAIQEMDEPVVTLRDLAEVMEPSKEAINPRLKELVESGELDKKRLVPTLLSIGSLLTTA
ncbi:hypothetical protein [Halonotius sp. GCM10025705]|uniref:hypothetical protein n=1 Tax=Halonotius sp. GCM10025705 TaxID=3252678 RepID=UPI0036D27EAE